MEYRLIRLLSGLKNFIEINESRFLSIKGARSLLVEALFIEEKFELLIENYLEYEQFALNAAAEYIISPYQDDRWFQTKRNTYNRLLINFLSTCKMYTDHISHHLSKMYKPDKSKVRELKEYISNQYDQYFGYRLMEEIRNFMQHRSYPVKTISFNSKKIEVEGESEFTYTFTAYINPQDLKEEEKFKKSILDELEKIGSKIDITPFVREYISCFGRIHGELRKIIQTDIEESDKYFLDAINEYKSKFNEDVIGLAAAMKNDEGRYPDKSFIFDGLIEQRKFLQNKNRDFNYLSKQYVSGKIIQK